MATTSPNMSSAMTHFVGFHASAAKGVWNAVLNAKSCNAKAFAFFTRSSRTWTCPELKPQDAEKFKAACVEHGFSPKHILPHGTYLSNCGAPLGSETRAKSLDAIKDEMRRCAALGLHQYNWHPGSATGCAGGRAECVANVSAAINECLAAVPGVTLVIETMAAQGSSVGSSLEEVRDIIAGVGDKARIGVCIDTAHIHGAGYDITTGKAGWDAYMARFEATVGLQYLRGMHLNDSRVPCGSKKDRHWNLGKGFLSIEPFRAIMNDPRLADIPLILETPPEKPSDSACNDEEAAARETYTREIALLYALQGTQQGDPVPFDVKQAPWARPGGGGGAAGGDSGDEDGAEEGQASKPVKWKPVKGAGKKGGKKGAVSAAASSNAALAVELSVADGADTPLAVTEDPLSTSAPPPARARGGKRKAASATVEAGDSGAAASQPLAEGAKPAKRARKPKAAKAPAAATESSAETTASYSSSTSEDAAGAADSSAAAPTLATYGTLEAVDDFERAAGTAEGGVSPSPAKAAPAGKQGGKTKESSKAGHGR